VSSIAPTHPHHPIAQFLRILRDLATAALCQPPSRTLSESLRETLIFYLASFIRRLNSAAVNAANPIKSTPTPSPAPATKPRPACAPDPLRRCTAWLVHLAPAYLPDLAAEIEVARTALATLLSTQDAQNLARETPSIGRILRPLCRMFGIEPPDGLRLPPPIRKPRPKQPPQPPKPRPRRDFGFTLVGVWDALGIPTPPPLKKSR